MQYVVGEDGTVSGGIYKNSRYLVIDTETGKRKEVYGNSVINNTRKNDKYYANVCKENSVYSFIEYNCPKTSKTLNEIKRDIYNSTRKATYILGMNTDLSGTIVKGRQYKVVRPSGMLETVNGGMIMANMNVNAKYYRNAVRDGNRYSFFPYTDCMDGVSFNLIPNGGSHSEAGRVFEFRAKAGSGFLCIDDRAIPLYIIGNNIYFGCDDDRARVSGFGLEYITIRDLSFIGNVVSFIVYFTGTDLKSGKRGRYKLGRVVICAPKCRLERSEVCRLSLDFLYKVSYNRPDILGVDKLS